MPLSEAAPSSSIALGAEDGKNSLKFPIQKRRPGKMHFTPFEPVYSSQIFPGFTTVPVSCANSAGNIAEDTHIITYKICYFNKNEIKFLQKNIPVSYD